MAGPLKKYCILGHANAALAILLDSLFSRHGNSIEVEIVSNILPEQNELFHMTYLHPGIKTTSFHYRDWQPKGKAAYLLGGMSPKTKKTLFEFFHANFAIEATGYETVSHANVTICNGVSLGRGCNISPGTTVAPFSELGNFVTLNRHVSIGHHTTINDFASINPGCTIGGLCTIGRGVQVGLGANILNRLEIGENAIIGAGSLVTKNVPANTMVYGIPAKVARELA